MMSTMHRWITAALAAFFMPAACTPAMAQQACGKRADLIRGLDTQFHEKQTDIGMLADSRVIELYVNDKGDWSMIATRPDGLSCLIATGRAWERLKTKDKDPAT